MKKSFLLTLIFSLPLTGTLLLAQTLTDTLPASAMTSATATWAASSSLSTTSRFIPGKMSTNLQLGSFFTTTSGYGSSFTTFVTPQISYNLSSRFRINAGVTVLNSNLFGIKPWYSYENSAPLNGNYTNAMIMIGGDYLVSNRLTLSGMVFKEFNLTNSVQGYNPYSENTAHGVFMKADYKVFDNFHIQAGFGYSKGVDPYSGYYTYPGSYDPFSPYGPFNH